MVERQTGKPEIAGQKRTIKLAPALGDWTTYKPAKILVKRIKTGLYGFDRLSQEELKLFLLIHYNFVQLLLKKLKIDLKMSVELFTVSVEQTTYLNFMRTLSGSIAQIKLSLAEQHEPINFVLDLSLANSIINYGLGSHDLEPINRALTEAENKVLSTAISSYLPEYVSSFKNIFAQPNIVGINTPDAIIDPSINTSATFVSFVAEVSLADNPIGKIVIGYPGIAIKALLAKYKQKEKALNFSRLSPNLLAKISVPVSITLGETILTTKDIQNLDIGDVVSLSTSIKTPTTLNIGNIMKLLAQSGIKDNKTAIRIIGLKEERNQEIEPPAFADTAEPESAPEQTNQATILPDQIEAETQTEDKDLAENNLAEDNLEEEDFGEDDFTDTFEDENLEDEDSDDIFGEEETLEDENLGEEKDI